MKKLVSLLISVIGCLLLFAAVREEVLPFLKSSTDEIYFREVQNEKRSDANAMEMPGIPTQGMATAASTTTYATKVYGYRIKSDNGQNTNCGMYTIDLKNLNTFEKVYDIDNSNYSALDGAYADGTYYIIFASQKMGSLDVMGLHKLDLQTGEYELIGSYVSKGQTPDIESITYDYSTGTLYAYTILNGISSLSTLNTSTGEISKIADISTDLHSIACTYNGKIYGITTENKLVRINKLTGKFDEIGDTGLKVYSHLLLSCGMEFNHTDEALYFSYTESGSGPHMATIDTETGKATVLGILPENSLLVGLYIPFKVAESGAPDKVTNFSCTADANRALKSVLSWKNPSKTFGGDALSSITTAKIYCGGELVKTLNNPVPGQNQTCEIQVTASGLYEYEIVLSNSIGKGISALSPATFVGEDLPGEVQNLKVVKEGNNVKLTWSVPVIGQQKGHINTNGITYTVTRLPDQVEVATGITECSYTDNDITKTCNYSYQVQSCNVTGKGSSIVSNIIFMGSALELPYYNYFETDAAFSEWTVIDDDGYTWERDTRPYWGGGEYYTANYVRRAPIQNKVYDYLISAPVKLKKGAKYRIKFDVMNNFHEAGELKLTYGKGATAEAQNNVIATLSSIKDKNSRLSELSVKEDGEYNIGFCTTDKTRDLCVYNFSIEEAVATDIAATLLSGNAKPSVNATSTYKVLIINNGSTPVRKFTLNLEDEAKNVLATKVVNWDLALDKNEMDYVDIDFEPQKEGKVTMRAHVILENDMNNGNDYSYPKDLQIQPRDNDWISIVNPGYMHPYLGIPCMEAIHSLNQNLYTAEEIKRDGALINTLQYFYMNSSGKTQAEVEIWMSNTEATKLGAWIYPEEQQLVFSGTIDFETSKTLDTLSMNLQHPFVYTGHNLCITTKSKVTGSLANIFWIIEEDLTNNYRCSILESNTTEIDPHTAQEGTHAQYYTSVRMLFNTASNNLKGVVKNGSGQPLENFKVSISNEQKDYVYTNEKGEYKFYGLNEGKYTVSVSNWEYQLSEAIVDVTANEVTTHDFVMTKRPLYSMTGKITSLANTPLDKAWVKLVGDKNMEAYSNQAGEINLTNIPAGEYDLSIFAYDFEISKQKVNLLNGNVNLGTLKLKNIPTAITDVTPEYTEDGNVKVSWNTPNNLSTFAYDNNILHGQVNISSTQITERNAFLSVHRKSAYIKSISWAIAEESQTDLVNLYIFDLGRNGELTSDILFVQKGVRSTFNEINTYELPYWVEAPNGFAIGIGGEGITMFGDDGHNFTKEVNYFTSDYNNVFTTAEKAKAYFNFTLRAEGALMSNYMVLPQNIAREIKGEMSLPEVSMPKSEKPEIEQLEISQIEKRELPVAKSAQSLANYKVWRFVKGNEISPNKWELLTPQPVSNTYFNDQAFKSIPFGIYRYAVRAIYPGDITSAEVYSKDMAYNGPAITVNVSPAPESAGNSIVTLTNKNGVKDYIFKTTTDRNGVAKFKHIVAGTYTLRVVRSGFEVYEQPNLDYKTESTYTVNVILSDKLEKPVDAQIVNTEINTEKVFNWHTKTLSLFDDFESHTDFTINSPGAIGWQYIDADDAVPTVLTVFPYNNVKSAFQVINMYRTSPPFTGNSMFPYSGDKVILSTTPDNIEIKVDNYIISPRLNFEKDFKMTFMASIYKYLINGEHVQVGYSISGCGIEDFTIVGEETIVSSSGQWQELEFNFPKEAKYVMINHSGSSDFAIFIDDILIGYPGNQTAMDEANALPRSVKYEVYLDNTKIGETQNKTYRFTNLTSGTHTAGVKAVYSAGSSEMSTVTFTITGENIDNQLSGSIKIYPNPAKDWLHIDAEQDNFDVRISSASGSLVLQEKFAGARSGDMDISSLPAGLYIVEVISNKQTYTCKLTVR